MLDGCLLEDQSAAIGSDNDTTGSEDTQNNGNTNQSSDNDTGSGTSESMLTLDTSMSSFSSLALNGGSLALTKSEVDSLTIGRYTVGILLYRNYNAEVLAFGLACTHADHQLNLFNSSGFVICSLHRSIFKSSGQVHSGTGNSNLKAY